MRRALNEADVVHIHSALYLDGVVAAYLAHRRRIPVILTEHVGHIDYRNPFFNWLERLAFSTLEHFSAHHASAITVLNQKVEAEMRCLAPASVPIVKIANGGDTERFSPASADTHAEIQQRWKFEGFTALFVGRLVEKKGYHLLIEAASEEFNRVVCGEGGNIPARKGIRALGSMEQEALFQLYQAADVFVLPSEGEGFPLALQEAMACGLPVIVTDNAVNHEYLGESVAIFVERSPDTPLPPPTDSPAVTPSDQATDDSSASS